MFDKILEYINDCTEVKAVLHQQDDKYYIETEYYSRLGEDVVGTVWFDEKSAESLTDALKKTPDDIYDEACGLRPAIRAEQLRLDASEKTIAIAQAAYMPSLSLSAGLGTNYYSNYGGKGFWEQMNDNFSQYIGLSLSIPIFNRFSTRNQVRSAQLNRMSQQVRLRQVQQQLYKEIQQAWNGAVAARAKYDASILAADAAADAFELVLAKYENGKAAITEFNESRAQMLKTRSDCVQATYEYLFQTRLVNFYRGGMLAL